MNCTKIAKNIPLNHIGRIFAMAAEIPKLAKAGAIDEIDVLPGGLTNNNYKLTVDGVTYALRLAGDGTMEYLNRPAEKQNAQLMADIGVNAEIIDYDDTTGNQVCKYVDDSVTMHPAEFRSDRYIKMAAKVFCRYHNCGEKFVSVFNPLKETFTYRRLLKEKGMAFYPEAEAMEIKLDEIASAMQQNPPRLVPCHNDPLCENWLDDNKNFYLIDWEYGGMNDPLFDLGALSIEAALDDAQEQTLLKAYFGDELSEKQWGALIINKFLCDALWSYWAVLQIAAGKSHDDYWGYGLNRYNRACKLLNEGTLAKALAAYIA